MSSVILCHENGIHLDGVVAAEIMFSHEKNISAEHPRHVEWFYNVAKPTIENKFGFEVIVVKSETDYVTHFMSRTVKSKYPERIGKRHGFVLGGNMCALKRDCKIKPIEKWCKQAGEHEQILGIAFDEQKRLDYMHTQKNKRSVMEEYKIAEKMAFDICKKYDLLSPFYDMGRKRQGCWFCPNCSIGEFAEFAKAYPEYWEELRKLSEVGDTVSPCFQYNRTFQDVDNAVRLINDQMTIFEV